MSELRRKSRSLSRAKVSPRRINKNHPRLEELETRTLLSTTLLGAASGYSHPNGTIAPTFVPGVAPLNPAEMRSAYNINSIQFKSGSTFVPGNGAGQTIAIVDVFNDPTIIADLHTFDVTFGLPDTNILVVDQNGHLIPNQTGTPTAPANGPKTGSNTWSVEESLDVDWAHAIAPGANIVVFEANSNSNANLQAAVTSAGKASTYAALGVPTAAVISNSYGGGESAGETTTDNNVYKPISDANQISLVFSSGDSGTIEYPASSPYVLGVGGTAVTLKVSPFGVSWQSETTYNDEHFNNGSSIVNYGSSGGGTSRFENQPSYQTAYGISGTKRTSPDVSMSGALESGVYVTDSYLLPQFSAVGTVLGTSLSAPMWAGIVAIVDQGRALAGTTPIGNVQEAVYGLPTSDFHDITTGTNGLTGGNLHSATVGYDLVTGIGTPIGTKLIPDLVNFHGTGPVGTFVPGNAGVSAASSTPADGTDVTDGTDDSGDDTSAPIARHAFGNETQAAAPVAVDAVQVAAVETAATPMTQAVRDLLAGPVTVLAPTTGQVQRVDTVVTQVTALPMAATSFVEGFRGDSTAVTAGSVSDGVPADGVLPTELAPQGDFSPVVTTTATVAATPATAEAVSAPAPALSATVSDAVFADLGAVRHEDTAPVAVIAGEETHSADLAVIAGLALAFGGLPGAFIKQEETRKVPALPAK